MKPVQRLGHFWPFSCEVFTIVYWKRLQNTSPQAQKNGQKTDINLQAQLLLSYLMILIVA